jgi:hypothetical protein
MVARLPCDFFFSFFLIKRKLKCNFVILRVLTVKIDGVGQDSRL